MRRRAWMLVFSSVEMTQSAAARGSPSHIPWYRSITRQAFSLKAASRGKIQVRWLHGRIASSLSQRHRVVSPMEATMPRLRTSCLISARLKRDNGRPCSCGSSQASALTATTTPGGKAGWAPAAEPFFEPAQALIKEALPPLADNLARGIEPRRDLVVAQALGGVERDLGPDDVSIR